MRRWLIFGIIFFVLFIFGAVIYVFFLGGDELLRPPEADPVDQNIVNIPPGSNSALFRLSGQDKVVSAALSFDENSVWYFTVNGMLYRDGVNGGNTEIYALPRQLNVKEVLWSLGNDFIVQHETTEGLRYAYYNAANKQFLDLPKSVYSLGWISALGKIIYVWRNENGSTELSIADPDATDFSILQTLDRPLTVLASNSGSRILLYDPYTGTPNQAYVFDTNTGLLRLLIDRGRNTGFSLSPDGTKLIFSRINDGTNSPELWSYDFATDSFTNLMIKTDASDVGWLRSSKTSFLYAAQTQVAEEGALVSETLYYYDIATGISSVAHTAAPASPLDFQKIEVSLDGKTILFINGNTGQLNRLKLP